VLVRLASLGGVAYKGFHRETSVFDLAALAEALQLRTAGLQASPIAEHRMTAAAA